MAINSFKDKHAKALFEGERGDKRWQTFAKVARRKLLILDAAMTLTDLKSPGNHLEVLRKERDGQHAIWINNTYRICFVWINGNAINVEIVDYH